MAWRPGRQTVQPQLWQEVLKTEESWTPSPTVSVSAGMGYSPGTPGSERSEQPVVGWGQASGTTVSHILLAGYDPFCQHYREQGKWVCRVWRRCPMLLIISCREQWSSGVLCPEGCLQFVGRKSHGPSQHFCSWDCRPLSPWDDALRFPTAAGLAQLRTRTGHFSFSTSLHPVCCVRQQKQGQGVTNMSKTYERLQFFILHWRGHELSGQTYLFTF